MAGPRYQTVRRKIILLDADDTLSRQVSHVFGSSFVVVQLRNPRTAIAMLTLEPDICAIITEQVMRGADGVALLESIRTMRPAVRRILVTQYSDLAAIADGLHNGAIQSLVQKPATDAELLTAVFPEMAQRYATSQLKRATA